MPHAPGGNSDTFGRILAQKLTERVGQQVVVENRRGAGGTAKLNQEIAATLREPETQERLAKLGLIVIASPQSGSPTSCSAMSRSGARRSRTPALAE